MIERLKPDDFEAVWGMAKEHIDERLRANAEAVYFNQDGDLVLEATLKGILPDAVERRILSDMVAGGDPTNKIE